MSDKHAIIDIGSNTVRLVVYDGPSRAPAVLLNEKVTAKLGRDVAKHRLLSAKATAIALSALGRYAMLLRLMAVAHVDVVATAAARDAENGEEFLAAVRALGLSPRLLTGEEEALTSAVGVLAAFPGARGVAADLGGGSLELTELDGDSCRHGISMPFGTLRLPDLRAQGPAKFDRTILAALQSAQWSSGRGVPLYLVGGSLRALARFTMLRVGWPLDDPHGFELSPEQAMTICAEVAREKQPVNLARLSASRLASLPDTAALLGVLLREIQPSKLVFSSWGLREGLLYGQLDPATRAQDPLLASVANFVEPFGVTASHATMIAGWTAAMAPPPANGDERLRLAATMLALAAMRIEPNLRTEQAISWAMRKRWIGLDARGRALLAVTILANAGDTSIPAELAQLASSDDLRIATGWGLAVRLCRKLTGGAAAALSSTTLAPDDTKLILTLLDPMQALYSNAIGKDHRLLAEWFGLEPVVELLPAD